MQVSNCNITDVVHPVPYFVKTNEKCKWIFAGPHLAVNDTSRPSYILTSSEAIGFIFYERDKRKKYSKSYSYPSCEELKVEWRSKQASYGFLNAPISYYQLNNNLVWAFDFYIDWRQNPNCAYTGGTPKGAVAVYSRRRL